MKWTCTDIDNNQYGRKIREGVYEFTEKNRGLTEYEEDEYITLEIDLTKYSSEEMDKHISAYYKDIHELEELYGADSDWIIAECIFEQESGLY